MDTAAERLRFRAHPPPSARSPGSRGAQRVLRRPRTVRSSARCFCSSLRSSSGTPAFRRPSAALRASLSLGTAAAKASSCHPLPPLPLLSFDGSSFAHSFVREILPSITSILVCLPSLHRFPTSAERCLLFGDTIQAIQGLFVWNFSVGG